MGAEVAAEVVLSKVVELDGGVDFSRTAAPIFQGKGGVDVDGDGVVLFAGVG